jgi:hypothetical protein
MQKTVKSLLFIIATYIPFGVNAQVNESDSLGIKADLSVTGFYQKGNVQTLIFRTATNFSVKFWNQWLFKNQNSYVYQEFGNDKADEDILSLNFLYFGADRNIYPLALGFISTNYRRSIDLRYLIGGGASFNILDNEQNRLQLSITSEFEKTYFERTVFNRAGYNGESTINTFRGTIWINGRYIILGDKMILTHESYYQPSLEDRANFRWRAELGAAFPVWKHVNITLNYQQTFESIVMIDQKRSDQIFTIGFTLKSY